MTASILRLVCLFLAPRLSILGHFRFLPPPMMWTLGPQALILFLHAALTLAIFLFLGLAFVRKWPRSRCHWTSSEITVVFRAPRFRMRGGQTDFFPL